MGNFTITVTQRELATIRISLKQRIDRMRERMKEMVALQVPDNMPGTEDNGLPPNNTQMLQYLEGLYNDLHKLH